MGLFDTVNVFMECPYCGRHQMFDCQTKDLDNSMCTHDTYEKDTLLDRTDLPVFGANLADKSAKVWKHQDERQKAMATMPEGYDNLKYVRVIASCNSIECQFYSDRADIIRQGCPSGFGRCFHGKIAIRDGLLVGIVYDIEKDDCYTDMQLSKYKQKKPSHYKKLMKKYKHEPIACRNWGLGR